MSSIRLRPIRSFLVIDYSMFLQISQRLIEHSKKYSVEKVSKTFQILSKNVEPHPRGPAFAAMQPGSESREGRGGGIGRYRPPLDIDGPLLLER